MTRARLTIALAVLVAGGAPPAARAHQPHVVGDARLVRVTGDPELSRAYYARLPGTPARYVIDSPRPFTLYAQTTVPDVAGAPRDWRLRVTGPDGVLADRRTPASGWQPFDEPFGGDRYLTGPEVRRRVPAGRYVVEVSRPGGRGDYVQVIGEAERWDLGSAIGALFDLPRIGHGWFGRSWPAAWLRRTVPVLLVLLLLTAGLALVATRLLRRLRRRRTRAEPGEPRE